MRDTNQTCRTSRKRLSAISITITLAVSVSACGSIIGHPVHPQAAPAVGRLLSEDPLLIKESKVELKALGPTAMPALRDAVASAPPKQQARIVTLAMEIAEPQDVLEDTLFTAAASTSPAIRDFVAKKAGELLVKSATTSGQLRGTTAEDTLHKLLHDSDAKVRITAFKMLAKGEHKDAITNQDLDTLIHDSDPIVMTSAAALAAERGYKFTEFSQLDVQPALAKHLFDSHPLVRANACKALGLLGATAEQSVPSLRKLMGKEENTVVKLQAAIALARIGESSGLKAAIPVLRQLSGHSESAVRIAATTALAQAEIRNSQLSGR
jgi:HEAT repeat protein